MGKKLIYLFMLLILANISLAATISGSIYDFDLEQKSNVIVTVNSNPAQTIVAKDGTYSFELDLGEYIINAKYLENGAVKESTTENIKIEKDGNFILDLILFPNIEEEELFQEIESEVVGDVIDTKFDVVIFIVLGFALIGLGFFIYLFFKFKKQLLDVTEEVQKTKVSDKLEKQVLDFIKEHDGRVTQKEIRKKFPYSEAKMSLVISDLQSKDIVKRVKQGRGNIIILK